MQIKYLDEEITSKIRSSSHINNLSQCVTELVLNSLDAKSSAVAIRLNSMSFRIQVVDNGIGISKVDLEKIAHKYSTSKCRTLEDLQKIPKTYGYKGESLWCISNVSKTIVITSQSSASIETFSISISRAKHGKITSVKKRESDGTTVTVDGLFYKLPVRQKIMKKEFELDVIISFLKSMSIIHPHISITLRDDITGKLLFKRQRSQNIMKSFTDLYPEIKYDDTVIMKVHKDKITVEALLWKDILMDKTVQHIFVNKRPVVQAKLHAFICKKLTQDFKKNKQPINCLHPVFVVNIKCPILDYIIVYNNYDATVEFMNYDLIYACIEKLILNFFGKPEQKMIEKDICKKRKSVCGMSDLVGVVKGFGFKEWQDINERDTETFFDDKRNSEQAKSMSISRKKTFRPLPIEIHEKKSKKMDEEQEKKSKRNEQEISLNENFLVQRCEKNDGTIIKNFRRLELNLQPILAKNKLEDTLFSNFSNTEERGKEFLMYMFLKSTEMFRDASVHSPEVPDYNAPQNMNNTIETIIESNIFFQNVTTTKNHKLNENISVSVKLKRRKTVRDRSPFSEKYSFAVPKKRRTENSERKVIEMQPCDSHTMSPYFKEKNCNPQRNYNSFFGENPYMNLLKNYRTPGNKIISDQYKNTNLDIVNSYFTRDCDFKRDEFIEFDFGKCFDKFSMGKISFWKDSYSLNKSYLFNFDNIENFNNRLLEGNNCLQVQNNNGNKSFGRKIEKNNFRFNSFDFENLTLSPIPKVHKAIEIKNLKTQLQNFTPSIEKKITTWRRNATENNLPMNKSRYFTSEDEQHPECSPDSLNFTPCGKEVQIPKSSFKKFHTEPLDHSRQQYILRTKRTIDDFFSCSKLKKRCRKRRTENNLEPDEKMGRSPLWKKFLSKKQKHIVCKNQFKQFSPANNKTSEVSERKPCSGNVKTIESPDLFPEPTIHCKEYKDRDLTFLPNSAVSLNFDNYLDDGNERGTGKLKTLTAVETAKSSDLIVTINNERLMENGATNFENNDIVANSGFMLGNEWMKKINEEGDAFYYNKRTGMTSFLNPDRENIFEIRERPQFMPKGLSPVLIMDQKLDNSLSPSSRIKLQDEILKSYTEDLRLVKWEKCFNGQHPNSFFDNLYKKRAEDYEKEVPSIITKPPKYFVQGRNDPAFSNIVIENLQVLGQIEQKFIAVIDEKKSLLILFDQHAVHERVRLEDLLREYEGKSTTCEKITIFMNEMDVDLLKNHESYLNSLGIKFSFFVNGITVNGVPICISNKISKESPLPKLIQHFVREVLNLIKETRGVLTGLPKTMNDIINMEACRGSIKFGEYLTKVEMEKLLEKLSRCNTPFQCAHGRPTLIPLLTLNKKATPDIARPNLRRIVL